MRTLLIFKSIHTETIFIKFAIQEVDSTMSRNFILKVNIISYTFESTLEDRDRKKRVSQILIVACAMALVSMFPIFLYAEMISYSYFTGRIKLLY